eukprot:gene6737-13640_t
MSILIRPEGDQLVKALQISPLTLIKDFNLVKVGSNFDVLCRDGHFYEGKVQNINEEGMVLIHFPKWNSKWDYKGSFSDIYVAKAGFYSGVAGISRRNQYLKESTEPSLSDSIKLKKPKKPTTKPNFPSGTVYDDDYLVKPRRSFSSCTSANSKLLDKANENPKSKQNKRKHSVLRDEAFLKSSLIPEDDAPVIGDLQAHTVAPSNDIRTLNETVPIRPALPDLYDTSHNSTLESSWAPNSAQHILLSGWPSPSDDEKEHIAVGMDRNQNRIVPVVVTESCEHISNKEEEDEDENDQHLQCTSMQVSVKDRLRVLEHRQQLQTDNHDHLEAGLRGQTDQIARLRECVHFELGRVTGAFDSELRQWRHEMVKRLVERDEENAKLQACMMQFSADHIQYMEKMVLSIMSWHVFARYVDRCKEDLRKKERLVLFYFTTATCSSVSHL